MGNILYSFEAIEELNHARIREVQIASGSHTQRDERIHRMRAAAFAEAIEIVDAANRVQEASGRPVELRSCGDILAERELKEDA